MNKQLGLSAKEAPRMASMALLFAMHSFQPPPFMILDEVDAPFDKKNTSSLVSYLKTMKFQCIVISLKADFYCFLSF